MTRLETKHFRLSLHLIVMEAPIDRNTCQCFIHTYFLLPTSSDTHFVVSVEVLAERA